MKKYYLSLLLLSLLTVAWGQRKANNSGGSQLIEGLLIDAETLEPLGGVIVFVEDSYPIISTSSDADGYFRLDRVPLGRQTLKAQKAGYRTFYTDNIVLRSSKPAYLEASMEAQKDLKWGDDFRENRPLNSFSVVSTRSFNVEETQRYPGAINDPSRMALSFPAVQSYWDNNADMIIRGNPTATQTFFLEGVELLGMGHFAAPMSRNGGVSALSIALLDKSDFSAGGFAAEYGNAQSAVLDMHFRKGNPNQQAYSFRFGLIGIDFSAEGPIQRGQSSFLLNYRYSTLGVLSQFGLYVVRSNVANTFQDLSFNLSWESKDRRKELRFFGLGGLGSEQWLIKEDSTNWINRLDHNSIDSRTANGTLGLKYSEVLGKGAYFQATAGASVNGTIYNVNNAPMDSTRIESNSLLVQQYSLSGVYSKKLDQKFRLKTGLNLYGQLYDLHHDYYNYDAERLDTFLATGLKFNYWARGYAQIQWNLSKRWQILAAGAFLFQGYNNTYCLEPRTALMYRPSKKTKLALSYGVYGQLLPLGTYETQTKINPNETLEIANSQHLILSWRQALRYDLSTLVEAWYQYGSNQPIGSEAGSTFWLYNQRKSFGRVPLASLGANRNYGIDLSIEKVFRRGFFLMSSLSLFRSNYRAIDNNWYRSRYDNHFVANFTTGYEWTLPRGGRLLCSARLLANGGYRYMPADTAASLAQNRMVFDESQGYSLGQSDEDVPVYYRLDFRLAYRKNYKKSSLTLSLDVQNMSNNLNNLYQPFYHFQEDRIYNAYQSGILPVIAMELDF